MNTEKTHYMIFHHARFKPTMDVLIRHDNFTVVKNCKFLGIIKVILKIKCQNL